MRRIAIFFTLLALWLGLVAIQPGVSAGLRQTEPGTPQPTTPPQQTPVETSSPEPGGLQVTSVEPDRISPLTGGTLSIYGSGFTQGAAVRLVGFGLLSATVVNSQAIIAAVPPGMPERSYDLVVILPDGASYRVKGALRIKTPKGDQPTKTPTPGRAMIFGQPQLVIESASSLPEVVRPGSTFTLTLQVVNRGDYTATNVRVALGAGGIAIPRGGGNLTVVDLVANAQTVEITLPLVLSEEAPPGYQNLALTLEYSDYRGRSYQSSQSVGVSVNTSLADQPLVLLSGYRTRPESPSPGEAFTLELELSNAGQSDAEQLLLTLGGEGGTGLQPFAILDSGNVRLVPRLAPAETIRLEQRFILDGSAEAGVYDLPVTLAYDSPGGERTSVTQVLNLLVNRRPKFQVDFYRELEPGQVGQPLELPIELVNIGRSAVNVSTAEVRGENLEIQRGSAFIGVLDGGTTASLDALVVPQAGGSLPLTVYVHYLDDFNQPQMITQTLTVEVQAPLPTPQAGEASPQGEQQGGGPWATVVKIVRGLLGLGS